jgi:hypothetical protein
MKSKVLLLLLIVSLLSSSFAFVSCSGQKNADNGEEPVTTNGEGNSPSDTPDESQPPVTTAPTPENCTHEYALTLEEEPLALLDGIKEYSCPICGDSYTEAIPATKSLKVLAIGNSFSVDATEYLWKLCAFAGVVDLVVGRMHIGGCSLNTHMSNIESGENAYTYQKSTKGFFVNQPTGTIDAALADEEWDVITIQQVSQNSGNPNTFTKLAPIVSYIKEKCPNAKIVWHMTWAYQQDTTHGGFANYNNDQLTMYNAIVDTTKSKVLTNSSIDGVIPTGTAIQNLRTSKLGDTLTRDGYHMSLDIGRYTTALTWYAYLTGGPLSSLPWLPTAASDKQKIESNAQAIVEAVNNALASPFEITQSIYKE